MMNADSSTLYNILVCGNSSQNTFEENSININKFLRVLGANYPYTEVEQHSCDNDCYSATVTFEGEVTFAELAEFFTENETGEAWRVQSRISIKE